MRDFLIKLRHLAGKLVDGVEITLFIFVFIVVLCQIFWRYVLNNPLAWSEELSRSVYVWICLIGWIQATRADSHIRINFIYDRLPRIPKYCVGMLFKLMILAFLCYLVKLGWQLSMRTFNRALVSIPEVTYGYVYLALPVCAAICVFYMVIDIIVPPTDRREMVMD